MPMCGSKPIGGEKIETVNARDLHGFLESRQEFAHWIKARIQQYGFMEGADFTIDKIIIRKTAKIDYFLTIDMAKELSMVERNDNARHKTLGDVIGIIGAADCLRRYLLIEEMQEIFDAKIIPSSKALGLLIKIQLIQISPSTVH